MDKVAFYKEYIYKVADAYDDIIKRNEASRPRMYTVKPNGETILDGFIADEKYSKPNVDRTVSGVKDLLKTKGGKLKVLKPYLIGAAGGAALLGSGMSLMEQRRKNMRKRMHKSASFIDKLLGKKKPKPKSKARLQYDALVASEEAAEARRLKREQEAVAARAEKFRSQRGPLRLTSGASQAAPAAKSTIIDAAPTIARKIPKQLLRKAGPWALGGLGLAGGGAAILSRKKEDK